LNFSKYIQMVYDLRGMGDYDGSRLENLPTYKSIDDMPMGAVGIRQCENYFGDKEIGIHVGPSYDLIIVDTSGRSKEEEGRRGGAGIDSATGVDKPFFYYIPYKNIQIDSTPYRMVDNKLEPSTSGDTFDVSVEDNILTVRRTDAGGGWGQDLWLLYKPPVKSLGAAVAPTQVIGGGDTTFTDTVDDGPTDTRTDVDKPFSFR
jgi:hypothetical protein